MNVSDRFIVSNTVVPHNKDLKKNISSVLYRNTRVPPEHVANLSSELNKEKPSPSVLSLVLGELRAYLPDNRALARQIADHPGCDPVIAAELRKRLPSVEVIREWLDRNP